MSVSALCDHHLLVLAGIHVVFEPDSLRDAHMLKLKLIKMWETV